MTSMHTRWKLSIQYLLSFLLFYFIVHSYVKVFVPAEHPALFSEINYKIMAWGIYGMLVVIYLGPMYGWGEYSHYRGNAKEHHVCLNDEERIPPHGGDSPEN